jgi:hypothetical protein
MLQSYTHGDGFSVDASVRIDQHDRHGLERLLRYCARPPFAGQRILCGGTSIMRSKVKSNLLLNIAREDAINFLAYKIFGPNLL